MHRNCYSIYSTEVQRIPVSENTRSNLHIPLNPRTVYERTRYLKARIEIYLLCLRAFSWEQRVAVSQSSQLVEERVEWHPEPGNGTGFAVTLKIQSENSGVREPLARGRVEGLKAARIGLTSCPERCRRRMDIQQLVLN